MQRSIPLWELEEDNEWNHLMRQIGIGSLPQQGLPPAPALQLSVLSLSLSCKEIILPLCGPAPQIYYSSPSPSSRQDGSGVTQEKEKRGKRGRCLPSHFTCCKDASVCVFTTLPLTAAAHRMRNHHWLRECLPYRTTEDVSIQRPFGWLHFHFP